MQSANRKDRHVPSALKDGDFADRRRNADGLRAGVGLRRVDIVPETERKKARKRERKRERVREQESERVIGMKRKRDRQRGRERER